LGLTLSLAVILTVVPAVVFTGRRCFTFSLRPGSGRILGTYGTVPLAIAALVVVAVAVAASGTLSVVGLAALVLSLRTALGTVLFLYIHMC
jgi:hypothetical protein